MPSITAVFPQFFTHCAIFNFSAQDVTYITCQAGIRSCKLIAKSLISQKKGENMKVDFYCFLRNEINFIARFFLITYFLFYAFLWWCWHNLEYID